MYEKFGPYELLALYKRGVFPMADGRDDPRLLLIDPDYRGIFDLNNFHIPRRLKRHIRKLNYKVTSNQCFKNVIENCALTNNKRNETWINDKIIQLYDALHRLNHAHSIEVWENDVLIGGLYGVSLSGAFFGESMFSFKDNASKIALVHLFAALKFANYKLLDAQFHNNHLEQFNILEITRDEFQNKLKIALNCECTFPIDNFDNSKKPNFSSGQACLEFLSLD